MRHELINRLISEDKLRFQSYFIDKDDEVFETLSHDNLITLLGIRNKKIRFEAFEAVTSPFIINKNKRIISFILNTFKNVTDEIVADYVNFIVSSEDLFKSGALKYFMLIDCVSKLTDPDKASHISNIFWNKNTYKYPTETYIKSLSNALTLTNEELENIETEVCLNNGDVSLTLKK